MRVRSISTLAVVASLALAACSGTSSTPSPSATPAATAVATPAATPVATPTTAPATASPSVAVSPSDSPAPSVTPEATVPATASPSPVASPSSSPVAVSPDCMAPNLTTKKAGRLTLSTDNPAFPPWWGGDPATQYPNEPAGGDSWEVSDPYSGQGYESATAYAVAAALGYSADKVDWIPNAVFENAFKPGPKAFDFHMAQISIRPERAKNVDFSDPYFDANQSILAMTKTKAGAPSPILKATTIEALKGFKLGAAVGTTSLQLIENTIQPTAQPQVFNDNAAAVQALKNGAVDGLVVDLQTAFFMRDAQLEDFNTPDPEATVVGQFGVSAQVDQMGIVLQKDSPLTKCVDEAIAQIKSDGTLQAIYDKWISTGQSIPFFQ